MSSPTASPCAIDASVWQYYGPLLLGGVGATFLSGMTTIQTIVYVKLYHGDHKYLKALVFVVWAIDIAQTGLIWNALWFYLVRNFGDFTKLDDISIPFTMGAVLGWTTVMLVQSCYIYRIFCLSNRNFWITVPVGIIMIIRLTCLIGGSVEMFRLQKLTLIWDQYKWLVTLILCFSAGMDVTITATLASLLLIKGRSHLRVGNQVVVLTNLDRILDSLILYTLELGSLTGFMSILGLICWLQLDNHMIFVGLYTSFGKVHCNCLMAMLNMRYSLRQKRPMIMTGEVSMQNRRPHLQLVPRSSTSSPIQSEPVRERFEEHPMRQWKSRS